MQPNLMRIPKYCLGWRFHWNLYDLTCTKKNMMSRQTSRMSKTLLAKLISNQALCMTLCPAEMDLYLHQIDNEKYSDGK